VNQYAILARNHWRTHLSARYRALSNPDAFFTQLGLQALEEIDNLASAWEGPDRAGETFLAKAQRLHAARAEAESIVLRELILLPNQSQPREDSELETQPLG
jgi:hypothetical protein